MKIVHRKDIKSVEKPNGEGKKLVIRPYESADPHQTIDEVIFNTRYPEKGWAVNHISNVRAYILKGKGTFINHKEGVLEVGTGDLIEILAGEKYAWNPEGVVELLYISNPGWTPEQHQHLQ